MTLELNAGVIIAFLALIVGVATFLNNKIGEGAKTRERISRLEMFLEIIQGKLPAIMHLPTHHYMDALLEDMERRRLSEARALELIDICEQRINAPDEEVSRAEKLVALLQQASAIVYLDALKPRLPWWKRWGANMESRFLRGETRSDPAPSPQTRMEAALAHAEEATVRVGTASQLAKTAQKIDQSADKITEAAEEIKGVAEILKPPDDTTTPPANPPPTPTEARREGPP